MTLKGRRIVLGVTGSIAAYKAAELASRLAQDGVDVDVVLTEAAVRFVTPLTFRSLTLRPVFSDMFDPASELAEQHVALARAADAVVVAPASASTIARIAHGLGDDPLTLTVLATTAPVLLAPAMDAQMYLNAATQANLALLIERGYVVVGPEVGHLASGHAGPGRLSPSEAILGALAQLLGRRGDLAGRRIVVSAGGTQEPIDPVRFVGNHSSGKMGFAIAIAARDRGAEVVLVTAPTALPQPHGVTVIPVTTAQQMRDAVVQTCAGADAVIMAAAVADFRPAEPHEQKIKKEEGRDRLLLELVKTPDILAELQGGRLVRVGFAAETRDLLANAREKLEKKGLDMIAANDVTAAGSGFGADTNRVTLLFPDGREERLPLLSKHEVAQALLDEVAALIRGRSERTGELGSTSA